jgi:hypothetical protein
LDSVKDRNHFEQGETMGRKGVSKRKPKKSKSLPKENNNLSSNTHPGDKFVQLPVKDKGIIPNSGGANPAAGSNKKNRKGKQTT